MIKVKRNLIIIAGLFISGLNPSWARSWQKATQNKSIIEELNTNQTQNEKDLLYELNLPDDLSLPSNSNDVLVKRGLYFLFLAQEGVDQVDDHPCLLFVPELSFLYLDYSYLPNCISHKK